MIKTRLSPGIELHEIDKSQYGKTDYSITNTTTLVTGFANKGDDYNPVWINTKQNLVTTYGYPTTEFERYFYNAGIEILNRGGTLLMAKLPYKNESLNCFSYTELSVSEIQDIYDSEISCLFQKKVLNNIGGINQSKTENLDNTIKTFVNISNINTSKDKLLTMQQFDDLRTKDQVVQKQRIKIIDISRQKLEKYNFYISNNNVKQIECVGIIPVIVTPIAALYLKGVLFSDNLNNEELVKKISPISDIKIRGSNKSLYEDLGYISDNNDENNYYRYLENYSIPFYSKDQSITENTVSKILSKYFPDVFYKNSYLLDKTNLNTICVVVLKLYKEIENDGKLTIQVVESFLGSLDKNAKNNKNGSFFIDDIVNSNSEYINIFSNVNFKNPPDIISTGDNVYNVLGFKESETKKDIDLIESISNPLNLIFNKLKDSVSINIDIVCDAGVTTIAQCINDIKSRDTNEDHLNEFIKNDTWLKNWANLDYTPTQWFTIASKFDNFCKNIRQDCIYICDVPRNFCINGNQKVVRSTDLTSSIENNLIPKLKYLNELNSSYSAGYCNWFRIQDDYSGDLFWCPPSIKASGIYTYVDTYYHVWDAPAGLNHGVINNVIDTAFNPYLDEAGKIYQNSWNYAMNYPIGGIVLEGQKTFQKAQTALDRVNVRRLLNFLKKRVRQVSFYFLYEQNTEYMRQRFVDSITPIFEDAVNGEGISEYIIKCDEENNTTETIDRNELHCTIGIRPIKSVEYIILTFVVVNQSASISEMIKNV